MDSIFIRKDDLYNNQYSYEILKSNIYAVSLLDILKTQKLNADFCVKYILNPDFQLTEIDQKITIEHVKKLQPHISEEEFIEAQMRVNNKLKRRERIDSFEDFESFANRHM